MKKLAVLTSALAIGAATLMPALSPAAKGPTYTPKNCVKPKIKPGKIIIACGDGNFFIKHIHYSFYNGREAGGTGTAFANKCLPSCAEGQFGKYSVKFRLTKPRKNRCGGESVRYFHKIKITWKGDRPSAANSKHQRFELFCVP